jgi:hypothetical protein
MWRIANHGRPLARVGLRVARRLRAAAKARCRVRRTGPERRPRWAGLASYDCGERFKAPRRLRDAAHRTRAEASGNGGRSPFHSAGPAERSATARKPEAYPTLRAARILRVAGKFVPQRGLGLCPACRCPPGRRNLTAPPAKRTWDGRPRLSPLAWNRLQPAWRPASAGRAERDRTQAGGIPHVARRPAPTARTAFRAARGGTLLGTGAAPGTLLHCRP